MGIDRITARTPLFLMPKVREENKTFNIEIAKQAQIRPKIRYIRLISEFPKNSKARGEVIAKGKQNKRKELVIFAIINL